MFSKAESLPVSDVDNAHYKQKKMNKLPPPRVMRLIIGVIAGLGLLWLLFQYETPGNAVSHKSSIGNAGKSTGNDPVDSFSCSKSYDGNRPVTQYVVMLDAGSSGSRVHIYEFNNCLEMPRLVKEEFKMLEPGLSSFASDPVAAAHSLDPLLDLALATVPENVRKCTPIAVKATAGLRKLGDLGSSAILEAVSKHLTDNYPFALVEDGVSIMPGEDEGVYAWVTANYLLEKIGSSKKTPTVAVFDLGGGSTQIVFEPTFTDGSQLSAGDHRFELSFGGRDFVLYQHSYLGYGLNEATSKLNGLIAESQIKNAAIPDKIISPCLPPNSSWSVKTPVRDGTTTVEGPVTVEKELTFEGPDVASPLQCRYLAEKILEKDATCANPPCAFGGVHQPKFFDAFPRDSDMYVFSFFYDRTFPLGMPSSFSLDDLKDLTNKVCAGPDAYSAFAGVDGAISTLEKNPQWCLHLNYMYSLLHTGYDIHSNREVRIAKKINNNELGWCLGASLPLLDGVNWKCREI